MQDRQVPIPNDFCLELREALTHFYDHAYLLRHPFLDRFRAIVGADEVFAAQELRRLLLGSIEQLRPSVGTPPTDPAWRPYTILYSRYILGKDLLQIQSELCLGRRQVFRELNRAVLAMADMLWPRSQTTSTKDEAGDVVWEEIAHVTTRQETFDACAELERALVPARMLAEGHGIRLVKQSPARSMPLHGDPLLFRHLLVTAMSFAVRQLALGELDVKLDRGRSSFVFRLDAKIRSAEEARAYAAALPATLRALTEAQQATLHSELTAEHWYVEIRFPAALQDHVVAIIEDNEDTLALFRRYLAGHGYHVLEVANPHGVVERLAKDVPDVIVLDVMMRGSDGWEILRWLRDDQRFRQVPIAICTVLEEPEIATSLGADAYLHKPVRPLQLLTCLEGLLRNPRNAGVRSW